LYAANAKSRSAQAIITEQSDRKKAVTATVVFWKNSPEDTGTWMRLR
jgi:hypothetical protein